MFDLQYKPLSQGSDSLKHLRYLSAVCLLWVFKLRIPLALTYTNIIFLQIHYFPTANQIMSPTGLECLVSYFLLPVLMDAHNRQITLIYNKNKSLQCYFGNNFRPLSKNFKKIVIAEWVATFTDFLRYFFCVRKKYFPAY